MFENGPGAIGLIVAAFAGGAFGASVGALPAFTLTGAMVVVGETYALAVRTTGFGSPPIDITGSVAFGAVLGPHVSFAGGAAAVAYASRRGYLDWRPPFDYHDAKNILDGLGSSPDVLIVGGAFGVLGYGIAATSTSLPLPTDPVALGVVLSAFGHRVALGYHPIGQPNGRRLDMTPYEDERRRPGSTGVGTDGGRYVVEPWLPYQYRWRDVTALGIVIGVLSGYVAYLTASAFLAFGISVLVLGFLVCGVDRVPVTHHMALPASTAVIAIVDVPGHRLTVEAIASALPLGEALLLGAVFGAVGAMVGELAQRVLYAHADTHLDPPAASIVVTTMLIAWLSWIGVFPDAAWIPRP